MAAQREPGGQRASTVSLQRPTQIVILVRIIGNSQSATHCYPHAATGEAWLHEPKLDFFLEVQLGDVGDAVHFASVYHSA